MNEQLKSNLVYKIIRNKNISVDFASYRIDDESSILFEFEDGTTYEYTGKLKFKIWILY